jgi:hypothetical protein
MSQLWKPTVVCHGAVNCTLLPLWPIWVLLLLLLLLLLALLQLPCRQATLRCVW